MTVAEPKPPLEGNPDDLLLERLSQIALTPLTIRSIFLMLTRIHWSDPDNFGSLKPKLVNFVWSRDEKQRTVNIDYDYNYDENVMSQRPSIFVGTSDFDFLRVVVDNRRGISEDRSTEDYVKLASTNIILRHIGKTPDESWTMADLTTQFFLGMRKMLQEQLKVHAFEATKLVASKPFERAANQANSQFIVDLLLSLQYNAAWLIVREGHRLKTVTYKQCLAEFSAAD